MSKIPSLYDYRLRISISYLKVLIVAILFLTGFHQSINAQFTVIGSAGGTKDGTYATLTGTGTNPNSGGGVFAALNSVAQTGAVIVVSVTGNSTSEPGGGSNQLLNGAWTSLTIQPSGGAARTISGLCNNNPLIYLNGGTRITIDGLNDVNGNSLSLINTSILNSPTIEFSNGASNDTIRNCTILGSNPSTTEGTIYFAIGPNDYNVISSCVIGAVNPSSAFSANGIYAQNIVGYYNGSNTVTNCSISDYFINSASCGGIVLKGSSSIATFPWTITGNKLFQTVPRTITSGSATIYSGISVTSDTGGWTISNNVIGFANSSGTGRTTYTCASGTAVTPIFKGIELSGPLGTTVSNIDGNTVAGISFTTNSLATAAPGIFTGISTISTSAAYLLNIGVNSGNFIGLSSAPDSVICNSTSSISGIYVAGIYTTSTTTVNIKNNTVSGLVLVASVAADGFAFNGIHTVGTGGYTVSGNIIGGTGANDINIGSASGPVTSGTHTVNGILMGNSFTATIQTNTIRNITATSTGTIFFNGIFVPIAANALTIGGIPYSTFGNNINNLNIAGTTSTTAPPASTRTSGNVFTGINVTATPSSTNIKGNLISTINSASVVTGSSYSTAMAGIYTQANVASQSIDSNVVSNLNSTSTGFTSVVVSGITLFGGTTTSGTCTRNKIFGLTNANQSGWIIGINTVAGSTATGWTVANNMITATTANAVLIYGIRDEVATASVKANYYFNSVYIGGTISSGANPTYAFFRIGSATELIKNNIFVNERTGGTAKNYCIADASTTPLTGWAAGACNYNILGSTNSASATIGYFGTNDETFANWQIAGGLNWADVNSLSGISVNFNNPSTGNLHISLPSQASGAGTPIAAVLIDIDGVVRSTGTPPSGPTIGANELQLCNAPTLGKSITNLICNGGNNGAITLSASGGSPPFTYLWSNGATNTILNNLTAGTYTVSVSDAINCLATTTATVTQPAIVAGNCGKTNITCKNANNGVASVTASGGTPSYTYSWNTGATTTSISGLSAGAYSVTITDVNNCSGSCSITIIEPSALSASCGSKNITCHGAGNGIASVTASGGTTAYSYSWSNGGTASSISSLSAGTYSVTVTDANGCSTTCSAGIIDPASLTAICGGTDVACHGANSGTASVTAGGGTPVYHYLWSNGQTISSLTGLTAASYTVTVTDASGCTATCARTLTQPSSALSSSVSNSSPVCSGNNVNLSSTASGGTPAYSYSWSGPNGFNSTIPSPPIVGPLNSGTYTLIVTDAHGCTSTATTNVTVNTCTSALNLKLMTEGYYVGSGNMNPVMLNEAVSGANASQTDTITVELHNPTSPYAVAASVKTIVMIDGTCTATLPPGITGGTYYIAIRHRNTVQTWSASPMLFNPTNSYDFTTSDTMAYANNMVLMDTGPDIWAFYTGDINQDLNIDLIDFPQLDIGINTGEFGYYPADLNGDGNVDLLDFPVLDANINAGIFSQQP